VRKNRVIAAAIIGLAFVGYLLWSTLAAQAAECRVCVAFGPGRNCATASAATNTAARRSAQSTACGTLAHGMNDAIACESRAAVSEQCKDKDR
jgi:hypothetical protein